MTHYPTYSVDTLERILRGFEDRYGLASAELVELRRAERVPIEIPRFIAFVWADLYHEAQCLSRDGLVETTGRTVEEVVWNPFVDPLTDVQVERLADAGSPELPGRPVSVSPPPVDDL